MLLILRHILKIRSINILDGISDLVDLLDFSFGCIPLLPNLRHLSMEEGDGQDKQHQHDKEKVCHEV